VKLNGARPIIVLREGVRVVHERCCTADRGRVARVYMNGRWLATAGSVYWLRERPGAK